MPPAWTPAWWYQRTWARYLSDLLHYRSRRRYVLSIARNNPLGATDPQTHRVYINPTALPFPATPAARACIRALPAGDQDVLEQALAVAIIEHEAGHIRHSSARPPELLLGNLWNALEDERQERLQVGLYPELGPLFDFAGDLAWSHHPSTDSLLAACLLWRWEHDRPAEERRFTPRDDAERALWEQLIRPRVEAAWEAPNSDEVAHLARDILQILRLPLDAPIEFPFALCHCTGGASTHAPARGDGSALGAGRSAANPEGDPEGDREGDPSSRPPDLPPGALIPGRGAGPGAAPNDAHDADGAAGAAGYAMGSGTASGLGAGSGAGHDPDHPPEASPEALLAEVEQPARALARWLNPPPVSGRRRRPSDARGDLDLERYLEGSPRPLLAPIVAASPRTRAWMVLLDISGSMDDPRAPNSPLYPLAGAKRLVMMLNRAAEHASFPLGILAFDDGPRPMIIRPLAAGVDRQAQRRIAGITADGGTALAPALAAALSALAATRAQSKLLLVIVDGRLTASDSTAALALRPQLKASGVHVLPLYLGSDEEVIEANKALFGSVLACPTLTAMTQLVRAWLHAHPTL